MDEQSIIDFDLDLLLGTSNDDLKKKCLKINKTSETGIRNLKKKIINTDTLLELYHARCKQVVQIEKNILTTNENCREACIKSNQSSQNFERLVKENESLRACIQELQRKLLDNEHMNAATESHTRQLQQLVKQRDTEIEKYQVGNNLKLATIKDLKKKTSCYKKHEKHLITQICNVADVVYTKKRLTKKEQITLSKFMRLKRQRLAAEGIEKTSFKEQLTESDADDSDNASLSDVEEFTEVTSPVRNEKLSSEKKDLNSESFSIDTGRSSSPASSGIKKIRYIPEYFIDSPNSQSNIANGKPMERNVDSATSPIRMKQSVDMATSPMLFEISCEKFNNEPHALKHVKANSTNVDRAKNHVKIPSTVVSRITSIDGIEPISLNSNESCLELNNGIIDSIEPVSLNSNESHLELHNSSDLGNDNFSDCEVEMILKTMKLNYRVITPIPPTPSRPGTSSNSNESCLEFNNGIIDSIEPVSLNSNESHLELHNSSDLGNDNISDCQVEMILKRMKLNYRVITPIPPTPSRPGNSYNNFCECLQAAKVSEQYKALQSAFMKLTAEVFNMSQKINSLTCNNIVCVDKQPEICEKIDSLTRNMVCEDKQTATREKIDNLISNVVCVERQLDIHEKSDISAFNTDNSRCNDIEGQDYSTEKNNKLKDFTITDETQECVQTASKYSIQNISNKLQFDEEIGNLPTVSEVIANNEYVSPEQDTAGASLCKKKKKAKKLTPLEKHRKNLIPKSKKQKFSLQPETLRSRIKEVVVSHNNVKKSESAVTPNNDMNEKAVKVMAEIKSQKNIDEPKSLIRRKNTSVEKRKQNKNDSVGINDTEKIILRDNINDKNNGSDHHEYVSVSEPNNNTDVAENKCKNTGIGCGTKRRKSKNPEIKPIIAKSRMRYPPLPLEKDAITQTRLIRSKANGKFRQGQPDNNAEVNESDNSPPRNKKITKRDAVHKLNDHQNQLLNYDELDIFNDVPPIKKQKFQDSDGSIQIQQESIFCKMIDKFGVKVAKNNSRKASELLVNSINTKITESGTAAEAIPRKHEGAL